ncbi:MAG: hypothetical protein HUJ68_10595 [Clostridia bacterium]|nr:hypothetical protein [Clostridia bacterium]
MKKIFKKLLILETIFLLLGTHLFAEEIQDNVSDLNEVVTEETKTQETEASTLFTPFKNAIGFKVSLPLGVEYIRWINSKIGLGFTYGFYHYLNNMPESFIPNGLSDIALSAYFPFVNNLNENGTGNRGYVYIDIAAIVNFLDFYDYLAGFGVGLEFFSNCYISFPLQIGFTFFEESFFPMGSVGFRINF